MSMFTVLHAVQLLAVFVWARHLVGAGRTFAFVKGERPSARIQLFPLAVGLLLHRAFTAPLERSMVIPGVALLVASWTLFDWARASIRGRFFSYAYSNDTPAFVWTSGPYAYIRNPFYTSYMLSYIGAALLFPGWLPLGVVVAMVLFFDRAAQHEERKFERSSVAGEYAAYAARTGRFIPKFSR